MKILSLQKIKEKIQIEEALISQEKAFTAYSNGLATVPPVGHLGFLNPPGDYHIKYGMIKGDDVFIVKLAGSFSENPQKNLSSMQGLMLVISAETGKPLYLLQDEGYLTNLRTAIAGYISAKYLAPKSDIKIGVIGTGIQARMQIKILKYLYSFTEIAVFGRTKENIEKYIRDMDAAGIKATACSSPSELSRRSNLIITTTPATSPLLFSSDIQPGTHITAVGADSPGKQELDPKLFQKADLIAVDSRSQCFDHGEISHSIKNRSIDTGSTYELGEVISDKFLHRKNEQQITITDLTGIATQDIQIAKSVI